MTHPLLFLLRLLMRLRQCNQSPRLSPSSTPSHLLNFHPRPSFLMVVTLKLVPHRSSSFMTLH